MTISSAQPILENLSVELTEGNSGAYLQDVVSGGWNHQDIWSHILPQLKLRDLHSLTLTCKALTPLRNIMDLSIENSAAIVHAAKKGNTAAVKMLLQNPKIDPAAQHNSALHAAICAGNMEMATALLEDDRMKNVEYSYEMKIRFISLYHTLDYLAGQHASVSVLELLLRDSSQKMDNMLLGACLAGNRDVVEWLLNEKRVDPSISMNEALVNACQSGDVAIIKLLLQHPLVDPSHHKEPEHRSHTGGLGYYMKAMHASSNSPLCAAAYYGRLEAVELLLKDPRVDPEQCSEALITACQQNHAGIVSALLSDDRVDPTHRGSSAFRMACMYNAKDALALLLNDSRIDPKVHGDFELNYVKEHKKYSEILDILFKDGRCVSSNK